MAEIRTSFHRFSSAMHDAVERVGRAHADAIEYALRRLVAAGKSPRARAQPPHGSNPANTFGHVLILDADGIVLAHVWLEHSSDPPQITVRSTVAA